ncbi:hypothetical protein C2G38_2094947 [Gigaspora rosea]|uniref:HMG box domain-containing protein n=1 Tax=Gigaspora rosea TaxID=44941 RepID=A0A397UX76_9GLOM|nr:hypothetical protein C2G38_2094947 [Gigaspora rosea]
MASTVKKQGLSIDSSPEGIYCENCADRSNGDNQIENQETFDYIKSSTETLIKIPFPPTIKPDELVLDILKSKSKSPKMLNEFFIYRKVFVQELRKQNLKLKMTKASKLCSNSWHQASSNVKNEYRRLAREVEKLYIRIRNDKLFNNDDQRKHFTNTAPVNCTPAISDVIGNNSNNGNNIPISPCALEQSINDENPCYPYSHIYVPCSSISSISSIFYTPYYTYDNVYMPVYDGNMYLSDFSLALPPFQSTSLELFPLQPNNFKSYMTNGNLSDNINANSYSNVTDFTTQTISVEEPLANQNNFFDSNIFYEMV